MHNATGAVFCCCYRWSGRRCRFNRIVCGKHPLSTGLSRNNRFRSEIVVPPVDDAITVFITQDAAGCDTSIIVADQYASLFIDCCIKEIEQVASVSGAVDPQCAKGAALNGIVRRRVLNAPIFPAIHGCGKDEIPSAGEIDVVVISRCGRSVKSIRRASVRSAIARYNCRKNGILDAKLRSYVLIIGPGFPFVA